RRTLADRRRPAAAPGGETVRADRLAVDQRLHRGEVEIARLQHLLGLQAQRLVALGLVDVAPEAVFRALEEHLPERLQRQTDHAQFLAQLAFGGGKAVLVRTDHAAGRQVPVTRIERLGMGALVYAEFTAAVEQEDEGGAADQPALAQLGPRQHAQRPILLI